MAKKSDHQNRLGEIAQVSLGELSDEEVLRLLAERKQLQDLQEEYDKLQKEQATLSAAEEEKASIQTELDRLNKNISPDKPDDELLKLIEERRGWEEKLRKAEETLTRLKGGAPSVVKEETVKQEEKPQEEVTPVSVRVVSQDPPKETAVEPQAVAPEKIVLSEESELHAAEAKEAVPHGHLGISEDESFGEEKISDTSQAGSKEFAQYLEDLRHATGSIGKILEGLPAAAKKSKEFMLDAAKIDPAYAMHYADPTLKKDEDFNVKVASLKNVRNSGSALAEMTPDARTAKVVLAGIKSDYRNVRFLLPQMEGYDEMLRIAEEGALQKVKELKESVDVGLLIPKILQKNKEFMAEVEKMTAQGKTQKKEAA